MKICFLRLLATLGLMSASLYAQPKFNLVGGTRFEFGDLYYGSAKKILTIRNDGNDTLVLSNISASCGCTGTLMSNDHIAPNDSGALSITFNTKGISGHAEKAVTLDSNDPDYKKVRIIFSANVVGVLDVQPEYLYFQVKTDSAATQTVTIKNRGTSTFSITSATSTLENVALSLSQTRLKPAEEATLSVVLTPRARGTVKGNIDIRTDHPKVPLVQVRLFGLITEKSTRSTSTH